MQPLRHLQADKCRKGERSVDHCDHDEEEAKSKVWSEGDSGNFRERRNAGGGKEEVGGVEYGKCWSL